MRCLALAQAHAARGGASTFVTSGEAPGLEARLHDERFTVENVDAPSGSPEDAAQTLAIAGHSKADVIVADGYRFTYAFHEKLRTSGLPLVALDDGTTRRDHCADIVLNQNLYARENDYRDKRPHSRVLVGPRYVLLRREFLEFSKYKRRNPSRGRRLLVTLGGSDPDNVTERLVRALSTATSADITVVVGAANPRRERLESLAIAAGGHIRVRADVRSMAALMARSDVAISGGGSTVYELAFMGLPSVVGATTGGEERVLEGLASHGVFRRVGRFSGVKTEDVVQLALDLLGDSRERTAMSALGRTLIDGRGCDRVLDAMRELPSRS
jgi:UDP-2,4-diacetamido-2,4,6-trideoxy-beta-L-altropyranose hydrolase